MEECLVFDFLLEYIGRVDVWFRVRFGGIIGCFLLDDNCLFFLSRVVLLFLWEVLLFKEFFLKVELFWE